MRSFQTSRTEGWPEMDPITAAFGLFLSMGTPFGVCWILSSRENWLHSSQVPHFFSRECFKTFSATLVPPTLKISHNLPNLDRFHASQDHFWPLLHDKEVHKACGPDSISARVREGCREEFAHPLSISVQEKHGSGRISEQVSGSQHCPNFQKILPRGWFHIEFVFWRDSNFGSLEQIPVVHAYFFTV